MLAHDAPPHWTAAALNGVAHGFFGRRGGVSTGVYASLNAGPGSRDDPGAVAENRRRIAAAFAQPLERLVSLHQIHSPTVLTISEPIGREQADGLVTTTPGLVLSALAADCAPVLLADSATGVIGAAHAGWRGALGGVLGSVVAAMRKAGARTIAAAVGPCIHQNSYAVGPEFEAEFLAADSAFAHFFVPGDGDRRRFDLPGFCAARLAALDLASVEILPHDTYSTPEALFSHRRGVHEGAPDYGRNCAAIMLNP